MFKSNKYNLSGGISNNFLVENEIWKFFAEDGSYICKICLKKYEELSLVEIAIKYPHTAWDTETSS